MIEALGIGFVAGWVGSMPVAGAVSLLVVRRALAGRRRAALLLAAGAALAEGLWCLAARLGVGALLSRWPGAAAAAEVAGAVILLAVGAWFLVRSRRRPDPQADAAAAPPEEGRLRRRDAVLGFALVAGNPGVLFNWVAALTALAGLGWNPLAREADGFALGVAVGIWAWFALLVAGLGRLHGRLPATFLPRLTFAMGVLLGGLGLIGLGRVFVAG